MAAKAIVPTMIEQIVGLFVHVRVVRENQSREDGRESDRAYNDRHFGRAEFPMPPDAKKQAEREKEDAEQSEDPTDPDRDGMPLGAGSPVFHRGVRVVLVSVALDDPLRTTILCDDVFKRDLGSQKCDAHRHTHGHKYDEDEPWDIHFGC